MHSDVDAGIPEQRDGDAEKVRDPVIDEAARSRFHERTLRDKGKRGPSAKTGRGPDDPGSGPFDVKTL
jgi:hypothetical protein